jgi:hypothetical protein
MRHTTTLLLVSWLALATSGCLRTPQSNCTSVLDTQSLTPLALAYVAGAPIEPGDPDVEKPGGPRVVATGVLFDLTPTDLSIAEKTAQGDLVRTFSHQLDRETRDELGVGCTVRVEYVHGDRALLSRKHHRYAPFAGMYNARMYNRDPPRPDDDGLELVIEPTERASSAEIRAIEASRRLEAAVSRAEAAAHRAMGAAMRAEAVKYER